MTMPNPDEPEPDGLSQTREFLYKKQASHKSGDGEPSSALTEGSDAGPSPSEPQFLAVGRVVGPHGVRGELCVKIYTSYPERFGVYKLLHVGSSYTPREIEKYRFHKDMILLKLVGIDDRTQADTLRDQWLWISLDDAIPLQEGECYIHQIVGMSVITADGQELGRVTEIMETGANDVYVVQGSHGEILLPAIPDVIVHIDVPARRLTVNLLEGLVS